MATRTKAKGTTKTKTSTRTRAKTKSRGWTKGKPESADAYLAALPDDQRKALEKLRKTIRAAAPKAEECISYSLPAFRQDGFLVAYGATAKHLAFFPGSSTIVDTFQDALEDFDTSKGTIRFQSDKPLPSTLVKKIVKARIAENAGR